MTALDASRHRVVAIHQPNFFPWLGYFDKIARADVFVVLDDAQLPRKGASWINRVALRVGGAAHRVTMPIQRPRHGVVPINEVSIDDSRPWRADLTRTIAQSYARAAHFAEVFPIVEQLLAHSESNVAAFNLHAIATLCGVIGLPANKLVQSSAHGIDQTATERLIALIADVGGDTYLCGGGADGYQEDDKFAAAGIELRYQSFRHPDYPQAGGGEFVAGLSILDPLFNLGGGGVARLLGEGEP